MSYRADPLARELADRHYNRQKIGSPQFVPPGRCIVLRTPAADAFWVTSWPFAEFTKHAWAGAWVCSAFRNEGSVLSSTLIKEAIAITRSIWTPPDLGMITFVDRDKVRSANPGACYQKAGFKRVGETQSGLVAMQLLPAKMPDAIIVTTYVDGHPATRTTRRRVQAAQPRPS